METLIAYKGDAKLKKALIKEITKHEKMDAIVQGTYGKKNGRWKGCAVACSLRSLSIVQKQPLVETNDQHIRYETDLGISQTIARLEDRIFEGLLPEEAKTFPRRFAEAIPPGADLSLVPARFLKWVVENTLNNFDNQSNPQVVAAIKTVVQLWQDVIDGKYKGKDSELESAAESAARSARSAARSATWSAESAARSAESAAESAAWSATRSAWSAWSAESAARSAAWSAAWSAAESAESAAWSATWSAESAAWSAAWSARSAAESAAESAAWSATFSKQAEYLLKLLREAPVL